MADGSIRACVPCRAPAGTRRRSAEGSTRAWRTPCARVGLTLLLLAGCTTTGWQNALDPRGPQAARIADWFWVSFGLAAFVFATFVALLGFGLARARRRDRRGEPNELPEAHGRRLVAWGGVIVPSLILLFLLVLSAYTDRGISRLGRRPGERPLTLEIVGHQFWWEVRYLDPANPHREFTTANELSIPVGRPVRVLLESRDVIHSFWVPNLHGKTDLIPGRTNDLVLQADAPGVYRGQCAEFCGPQHAKMALIVVARDEREFEEWWDSQLRPHVPPADPALALGERTFMQRGCAVCHTIRGTDAHGTVAPDLSHFGSRLSIGAGIAPNSRGHLAGWIGDPQGIKPGSRMPSIPLRGEELRALVDYLHSLD